MKSIYIYLAVRDLTKTETFFAALGYEFNSQYTNEHAAWLKIEQNVSVMLLTHEHFRQFIGKPLGSAHESTQVLLCQCCDSRGQMDQLIMKAIQAGARRRVHPGTWDSCVAWCLKIWMTRSGSCCICLIRRRRLAEPGLVPVV